MGRSSNMVQNCIEDERMGAGTAAGEAVKRVVRSRLRSVEKLVGKRKAKGLRKPGAKYIHGLRVSCRRAEAGLELFEEWLASGPVRKLKRRLRRLRRSAGAVRVRDVQCEMVKHDATEEELSAAAAYASARWKRKRRRAIETVQELLAEIPGEELRRLRKAAIRKARGGGMQVGDVVARQVPRLVDELMESAADDLRHIRSLHQFRLTVKRLRYAVEAVAEVFEQEEVQRWLGGLEALSGRLGSINDLHEMQVELVCMSGELAGGEQERLKGAERRRIVTGLERLAEQYRERLRAQCEEFGRWWRGFLAEDVLGMLERCASRMGEGARWNAGGCAADGDMGRREKRAGVEAGVSDAGGVR